MDPISAAAFYSDVQGNPLLDNILPIRWGRIKVGVDKIETAWFPL